MNKFKLLIIVILLSQLFADIKFKQSINLQFDTSSLQFNSIVVSNLDNIYMLESNNHELYQIDFLGKIINKIGGFGWDSQNLNTPSNLCLKAGLNIIVADKNNHRLVRFDKNINFISSFPDENSDFQVQYPKAIEIMQDGILFILQENIQEILKLNQDEESYQSIGIDVSEGFELVEPIDIYLNKKEELFVLEKSGKILSFDRYGTPLQIHNLVIKEFNPAKVILFGKQLFLLSETFELYSKLNDIWEKINLEVKITDFYSINTQLYLLTNTGQILIYDNH